MHKYAFLVYHLGYDDFLSEIRKFGVIHILQKNNETTAEMQELFRKIAEVKQARKKLEWYKGETPGVIPETDGEKVFEKVKETERELEYIQHHRARLEKEEKQLEPWGNFLWENITRLESQGLHFRFFTCPAKKFKSDWLVEHYVSIIHEEAGVCYFVKIDRKEDDISDFLDQHGIEQLFLPDSSLTAVKNELKELQEKNQRLHQEMEQLSGYGKTLLDDYVNALQDAWQEHHVQQQTVSQVDDKVMLVEGFVPETRKKELDEFLDTNKILYVVSKPAAEEKVPVLLKNNRFARLYEVIGRLYDLPNHTELDLVPFFAPFYMMFFGFCLGDAGYGLLIITACSLAKRKMAAMRDILSLAQWLGVATVIFGALTGTFFGINLIDAEIPWLEGFKKYMIDTDSLFNLAVILGAIQILFGMVVKVFNIRKSSGIRYAFSTIGWLILIIGTGALIGLKKTGIVETDVASIIQKVVLAISFLLIFVFNHPKRNILINIGAGLWDAYGMASGLLGDLLSYIRLFALGVSSAILGFVFNELAMSLKPDNIILGPLVMIIILIIGHSITLFMATLGAFVHPMRLTFVEFYKNAGFSGGGKPYAPYKKHQMETNN